MAEIELPGQTVALWWPSAGENDRAALIGVGVDDGVHDDALRITASDADKIEAALPGATARRVTWSTKQLGRLTFLFRGEHAALVERIKGALPDRMKLVQAAEEYLRRAGADPQRFPSSDDMILAARCHERWMQARELPEEGDQVRLYEAIRHSGLYRFGLPLFHGWLAAVEPKGSDRFDAAGRLRVSVLLRHSGDPDAALEVSRIVELPQSRWPTSEHVKAMLCCHRAASFLDVAEREGDASLLPQAKRLLDRAWATDRIERDEISNTYQRLKALSERLTSPLSPSGRR